MTVKTPVWKRSLIFSKKKKKKKKKKMHSYKFMIWPMLTKSFLFFLQNVFIFSDDDNNSTILILIKKQRIMGKPEHHGKISLDKTCDQQV